MNLEKRIEAAKAEIIENRKITWKAEWAAQHKKSIHEAPDPPDSPTPNWFVIQWETGFAVIDLNEINKYPKYIQNKILKRI